MIIDCPGQIELYTHIPILPRLAKLLTTTLSISLVSVYLLESQFMEDPTKYFSGVLSAMSCMVGLEVPTVNVMSKMDLVRKEGTKRRKDVDRYIYFLLFSFLSFGHLSSVAHGRLTLVGRDDDDRARFLDPDPELMRTNVNRETNPKFHSLNSALVQLVSYFLFIFRAFFSISGRFTKQKQERLTLGKDGRRKNRLKISTWCSSCPST